MEHYGTLRHTGWKVPRAPWDETFFEMALVLSTRSSCMRRTVGAIAVAPDTHAVLSMGYNGTPRGMKNCDEGGCPRCASDAPPNTGYDRCLCVHAEQNVVALAAMNGVRLAGSLVYVTLRPCTPCLRLLIQAGVWDVRWTNDPAFDSAEEEQAWREFWLASPFYSAGGKAA